MLSTLLDKKWIKNAEIDEKQVKLWEAVPASRTKYLKKESSCEQSAEWSRKYTQEILSYYCLVT